MLEACSGDLDSFFQLFHTTEEEEIRLYFLIEGILNASDNREWRLRWDAAIATYKRIRITRAQRKALDVIARVAKPTATSRPDKDVQAHAKMLLNADLGAQAVIARKKAEKAMADESDSEPDALDAMIAHMGNDVKEKPVT